MGSAEKILKDLMPIDPAMAASTARAARSLFGLLDEKPVSDDRIVDVKTERLRWRKLVRLVRIQAFVILGLIAFFLFAIPVIRPVHSYWGRPDVAPPFSMASMSEPNLTDQAVLSWSVLAITEIMTFGFGDVDQRILAQRDRFTDDGWTSFLKGFVETEFYSRFKGNQLVLTTVPTNSPVIVGKGEEKGEYQWVVEMPIIMTYATVDNIAHRKRGIVRLTIARIPSSQNKYGIGIKYWQMG
jgi:intracellular multiplication protein IcmL